MKEVDTMTEKEMYAHVKEMMANDCEVVAFCEKKIAQINNKKSSKSNKPSKERQACEDRKAMIVAQLGTEVMTATEVGNLINCTLNQASRALKELKDEGTIVRTVEKGVAKFRLA